MQAALYRLMTWFSPSFPVGAFSYSHGLEYAVEAGLVHDRATLEEWVKGIIQEGSGRVDAILFCAAYRATEGTEGSGWRVSLKPVLSEVEGAERPDIVGALAFQGQARSLAEVVETAAAMRGTAELTMESVAQGRAFLGAVRAAWPCPELEGWVEELRRMQMAPAYPVAVAVVCAVNQIPLENALSAYLHAFAANLASAGVRLIPLGQIDGQKVIAALEKPVTEATQAALQCPLEDLGSATPMVDWTSMHHETQYTRLFRS